MTPPVVFGYIFIAISLIGILIGQAHLNRFSNEMTRFEREPIQFTCFVGFIMSLGCTLLILGFGFFPGSSFYGVIGLVAGPCMFVTFFLSHLSLRVRQQISPISVSDHDPDEWWNSDVEPIDAGLKLIRNRSRHRA